MPQFEHIVLRRCRLVSNSASWIQMIFKELSEAEYVCRCRIVLTSNLIRNNEKDLVTDHVMELLAGDFTVDGGEVQTNTASAFGGDLSPAFSKSSLCGEDDAVERIGLVIVAGRHQEVRLAVFQ